MRPLGKTCWCQGLGAIGQEPEESVDPQLGFGPGGPGGDSALCASGDPLLLAQATYPGPPTLPQPTLHPRRPCPLR